MVVEREVITELVQNLRDISVARNKQMVISPFLGQDTLGLRLFLRSRKKFSPPRDLAFRKFRAATIDGRPLRARA